jgi:hypothetical protein
VDVYPDGYVQLIREGIVRARYTEMLPAGQTVHHSREYPSALVLPVILL